MADLKLFLDDLDDQHLEIKRDDKPIINFIEGYFIKSDDLQVFVHEEIISSTDKILTKIIPQIPSWLYKYSRTFTHANPEEIVFLDTETTGLDRGVSTYAFLTGLLYFQDKKWILKQFFIESPEHEVLLMELLAKFLADFKVLISFNGKCYDIPLLDNRFKFHRKDYSIRDLEFIDLLHLSRRLWKHLLHGCSLQNIETLILSFIRDYATDIPGEMIPKTYFDYLATGNAEEISSVFYHNKQDLTSLVRILHICSSTEFFSIEYLDKYKIDFYSSANLLYDIGLENESKLLLTALSQSDKKSEKSIMLLVKLLKRDKKYQEALTHLAGLESNSPVICLEMAKLYEHQVKDIDQAFYYARKAYIMLHEGHVFDTSLIEDAEKRITRIKQKIKSRNN